MTSEPRRDASTGERPGTHLGVEDAARQLRALERRLRRERPALERINPLEQEEAYLAGFEQLVALEARRRDLRARVDAGEDVLVLDDPPGRD